MSEVREALAIIEEIERRKRENKIRSYYPDTGKLAREFYKKHMAFFAAGSEYNERLMLAANRVGKTEGVGAYEVTLHLTGDYPIWWPGRRFNKATEGWAAGDSLETVRDIIQNKLLGKLEDVGTGMIPKDKIHSVTRRTGKAEMVDTIYVRHKSGGISSLALKSYDQGRKSFQGTKKDFLWLDEEPPLDIYTECLLRTMDTSGDENSTNGLMILTFTPLSGMSETVLSFLPNGEVKEEIRENKYVVMASWDDVPHLTKEAKDLLWASIPPHQRDARSKGIPALGSGAIYPVTESDIFVDDFAIPDHWPRAYGLDVGWNRTACAWGALDKESDILYVYSEHYRGQAEASIHAESIKSRGDWIPGVIDPASRGRAQADGKQLLQMYIDLGLDIDVANNAVESGIYEVWQRMSTGRLKIFNSCSNIKAEFRLYRRDDKGRIVKESDHLMDALRYLVMSGILRAKTKEKKKPKSGYHYGITADSWMS